MTDTFEGVCRPRGRREPVAIATVRCVACRHEQEVRGGLTAADDVPMCERCFSPMVAVKARVVADESERRG